MFALAAAVCFLLALLRVHAGIDLVTLGWLLLAVHLVWAIPVPLPSRRV